MPQRLEKVAFRLNGAEHIGGEGDARVSLEVSRPN